MQVMHELLGTVLHSTSLPVNFVQSNGMNYP